MICRTLTMTAVLVAMALPAAAQPTPSAPLSLAEVLSSVRASHPTLAAAGAKVDEARGDKLAATAVFDPVARAYGNNLVAGYYEYWLIQTVVQQQLDLSGVDVSAGYRLGRGTIPTYYGERATRSGGELFSELRVPLFNGRAIDSGRARLRKSRLKLHAARQLQRATGLRITRDAQVAYWEWVAAAQKLTLARQLLDLARERTTRINARANSGALPRITIVDSQRVVLERRSRLLSAQRSFARAQAKLSLYYRDASGRPLVVSADRSPTFGGTLPAVDTSKIDRWIADALAARPELALVDLDRRATLIDRELAQNQQLPKLDIRASVARDLGAGDTSLRGTDVAIGLSFELPLFRRRARGAEHAARAKLARLAATRRGTRDRVAAQVRMFVRTAALSHQRWRLASERLEATRRLAAAERKRFETGASDMIRVNLRELAVASATRDAIEASLELRRARADLLLARGRTPTSP